MITKTILHIIVALLCCSCLRLDNNLFNKKELLAYELELYTGAQDFVLDSGYAISPDKITLFSLKSQLPEEQKASTIYAVYLGDTATIKSDTVILYCHGNRWHMDFYWQRAKLIAHTGGKNHYGVLMLDYRGYGMSEGTSSEATLYQDVDVAMQWLKSKGLVNNRLVIYGFSMGTFPSCELCAYPRSMQPFKIILEAPYANSAAMVADASGIALPSSYVTNLEINNAEKMKQVQQPLLWIHGTADHYCKLETQGLVVYDNHKGKYKEKEIVSGAEHGNVPLIYGFKSYTNTLDAFIKKP